MKNEAPTHELTSEEMKTSWQELREMLSGIDGNDVDFKQLQEERRTTKYERFAQSKTATRQR